MTAPISCLNGTGMCSVEQVYGTGLDSVFGDPTILGLMVVGALFGFAFINGFKIESLILIAVPAAMLALSIMPPVYSLLFIVVFGTIVYFGIMRMVSK